ncbi:MAG: YkvA family protein [Phycisphaeraceae bacterium]
MDEPLRPDYSDETFWDKLKRYALVAGKPVVEMALQLFYALQAPKTPKWAKTVIIVALAYFILPVDAVPDVIPVAGYTDDLGALAAAIATVHMYITDDIKHMAKAKLEQWFGKVDTESGS